MSTEQARYVASGAEGLHKPEDHGPEFWSSWCKEPVCIAQRELLTPGTKAHLIAEVEQLRAQVAELSEKNAAFVEAADMYGRSGAHWHDEYVKEVQRCSQAEAQLERAERVIAAGKERIAMLLKCHYEQHQHNGSPTCFDLFGPWEDALAAYDAGRSSGGAGRLMATAEELRCRIARIRAASERLDGVDYFGRNWIAEYAGDVDCVTDCFEEVLNQGVALSLTPFATEVADLLACQGHIPMGGC